MAAWPGWRRVDPRPWSKCSARWRHVSGWTLSHCGHPTALWPWELRDPRGYRVLSGVRFSDDPTHGHAWTTLADAFAWVAAHGRIGLSERMRRQITRNGGGPRSARAQGWRPEVWTW